MRRLRRSSGFTGSFALLLVLLTGLGSLVAGCGSTAPEKRVLQYLNTDGFGKRYTGNAEEENYVTIGDSIVYTDSFHPELAGQARVDIDGTILIPEAGAVHVAGLTRSEIEGLLTQKLSPYYEQNDIKVVIAASQKFYYTIGECLVTGALPFNGDLTIVEAVLRCRPKPNTSNLGRVKLIRADPQEPFVLSVDVGGMLESGDTTFNVHVQENDILYIPPTILKEVGNLLASLATPLTTLLQQISQSLFLWNWLQLGGVPGRGVGGGFGGGIF